jgi:hypothetical protein
MLTPAGGIPKFVALHGQYSSFISSDISIRSAEHSCCQMSRARFMSSYSLFRDRRTEDAH